MDDPDNQILAEKSGRSLSIDEQNLQHEFRQTIEKQLSNTTSDSQDEQEILANIQDLLRQLSIAQIEKQDDLAAPIVDSRHRLIMISNRLPISSKRDETTGEWSFDMSAGGLVTALRGIRDDLPFIWIGWIGEEIPLEEQPKVRERLIREFNCVPVFLTKEVGLRYYNGFSNDVLWPIFHYVPLPMFRAGSEKKFDFQLYDAYKLANQQFAQVVSSLYREGDYIWVHDYHLMILPGILRKRHPNCKIGWFLHTPFPSSEIYRVLPVRRQILEGVLGADLVGFHTYDYARHFLSACTRIVGSKSSPKGIDYEDSFVSVGVFPIGIDPDHFHETLNSSYTESRVNQLREKFKGKKIIIGVDRLDYIKGMPHRLLAFEKFLIRHPEWRENVVLIQIAVPSRTSVDEYKHLGIRVNKLVGRINGRFSTLHHTPIHYINQSISTQVLVELYTLADVCFVTSIRDGMNLVSHEYVLCQNKPCVNREGPGVLVLSEFAGSAQSLSGAIRINPWNTDEMATSLYQALTLPLGERELRQFKLYRYVTTHTASFWAKSFLSDLQFACKRTHTVKKLPLLPINIVKKDYIRSRKRLIISDYDGTLTQRQTLPALAAPKPYLRKILTTLALDEKNMVFIVSGREKSLLTSWFRGFSIGMAAENGLYFKLPDEEWESMGIEFDDSWRNVVRPIMQYFTERTPGSYIEAKESSLTWHYRDADPQFATIQARDMQVNLEDVLCNLPLKVVQENKTVETRLQGMTKALIVEKIMNQVPSNDPDDPNEPFDFIFCVGDDQSDEDMFSTIQQYHKSERVAESSNGMPYPISENAAVYTCHIGPEKSIADYYLDSVVDLRKLLRSFATSSRDKKPT